VTTLFCRFTGESRRKRRNAPSGGSGVGKPPTGQYSHAAKPRRRPVPAKRPGGPATTPLKRSWQYGSSGVERKRLPCRTRSRRSRDESRVREADSPPRCAKETGWTGLESTRRLEASLVQCDSARGPVRFGAEIEDGCAVERERQAVSGTDEIGTELVRTLASWMSHQHKESLRLALLSLLLKLK
jgi:hypothetical protein